MLMSQSQQTLGTKTSKTTTFMFYIPYHTHRQGQISATTTSTLEILVKALNDYVSIIFYAM